MTSGKDTIIACNDKLLFGLDAATGRIMGRWRGYGNGNLITDGKTMMLLHGDGKLSFFDRTDTGLALTRRYRVTRGRCWTPPTIVENQMFVRSGSKLICVSSKASGEPLEALPTKSEQYKLSNTPTRDYVGEIVAEFEKAGPAAAFALYQELHRSEGKRFSLQQRQQLAELAEEQKLTEFRRRILSDVKAVFP